MKNNIVLYTLLGLVGIVVFVWIGNFFVPKVPKVVTVTSSNNQQGFINSSDIYFPQGMTFAKAISGYQDLGQNALYYDYNPIGLQGDEWVATVKVDSDADWKAKLKSFEDFYQPIINLNDWVSQQQIKNKQLATLTADNDLGGVHGYFKYVNGQVQVILLYNEKDSNTYPTNEQLRLFLSNVTDISDKIK